jgi:NAD+ synthase (glutamine-hydrolysing)
MTSIHIATASLNQTPLDWMGNFERCGVAIREARERGVEILCLPELCISGYGCEDMFFAPWVISRAAEILFDLAREAKDIFVLVGLPVSFNGRTYNAVALIGDGKIHGIVPKQHLANDGIHYEARWFTPWTGETEQIEMGNTQVPFGKLLFSYQEVRFGVEICEDAWVQNRPANTYIKEGATVILNSSASHFSLLKLQKRIDKALDLASISPDIYYVYSNLLGNEAGRAIYDGSGFISKGSSVIAYAPRFSFEEVELVSVVLENISTSDLSKVVSHATHLVTLSLPDRSSLITNTPTNDRQASFETSDSLKEEEFTRAVSLGMFDYMRKSKSKGFVISLSGRADSSACACLAMLSLDLPLRQIDHDTFQKRIGENRVNIDFIREYVHCAYLKTENNSDETEHAAAAVAAGINAEFQVYEIDDLIESYSSKVQQGTGLSLSWKAHGIPMQNIQARSRGPLVWFLANLHGALLLSTSNRSEAAVGYTTMDGDTCGGLSPIGGIDKAFLLSWLRWLADSRNHSFGNFDFLEVVNNLSPSAELKPLAEQQTDEKDLMPYVVLDVIERGFIGEKRSPEELSQLVFSKGLSDSLQQADKWVQRFLELWQRNQWKRERYAPAFHLDDQSLDPKTWCRFPILSGAIQEP